MPPEPDGGVRRGARGRVRGASAPGAGGGAPELELQTLAGGVNPQPGGEGCGKGPSLAQHDVQLVVGAIRVVVEEEKVFDAGFGGLPDDGVHATVSPADAGGVLLDGVLGIVNEDVDVLDQVSDVAQAGGDGALGAGVVGGMRCGRWAGHLVVGDVGDGAGGGCEAEGDAAAGVMDAGGGGVDLADAEAGGAQFLDGDGAWHLGEGDGEERGFDGGGDGAFEAGAGAAPAQDADVLSGEVGGGEEGEALDMIPMGMGDQDPQPAGAPVEFAEQGFPEFADAGAGVQDDDIAAPADLHAGGIAAVSDGLGSGDGDRAPDAPKADCQCGCECAGKCAGKCAGNTGICDRTGPPWHRHCIGGVWGGREARTWLALGGVEKPLAMRVGLCYSIRPFCKEQESD